MNAVRLNVVGYAQLMSDTDLELEEGRDAEQDEIRVRCSKAMKQMMEGIAAAESRARELRGKTGKVSLNRLMKLVIERYRVAWSADNDGVAIPKSADDTGGVERAARAIKARKDREGRAKHQ